MDNNAMFKLSYGLYLLSARQDGRDNACIINTAGQVTTSPNRITIAVNKQNYTHDMIVATGEFNVCTLTTETPFKVFEHFGFQSGRSADKFAGCEAEPPRAANGIVYLPKYINAYISGKVVSATDLGTHTLFLAEVIDAESTGSADSLTYAYYQKHIKPAPAPAQKHGWRCKICGYVYEGDELPADFVCPLCKHGAVDFERI